MPHAVRDPHSGHGADPAREVGARVDELVARRHAQRARPTYGDDADRALLDALARLARDELALAAAPLTRAGERLGRDVYARRCFEDSMPGAMALLSTTFLASGWGSLALESWFHREATARFVPAQPPQPAWPPFLEGVLVGYFGEAFNCRAWARAEDDLTFRMRLLDARDVNEEARR